MIHKDPEHLFTDEMKQFMLVISEKFDGAIAAGTIREDMQHVVLALAQWGLLQGVEELDRGVRKGFIVVTEVGKMIYAKYRNKWTEELDESI